MTKYKVKHTSIMHNGKLYKEGSVVELTNEQAKKLADFVDFVSENKKTETTAKTSTNAKTNKTATKTKTEDTPSVDEGADGGNTDGK